jgi:DNA-binding MltR family transcriptional regulator
LYSAVSEQDLTEAIQALVKQSKTGDPAAVKLLVSILLGPPQPLDVLKVVAKLESAILLRGVQA